MGVIITFISNGVNTRFAFEREADKCGKKEDSKQKWCWFHKAILYSDEGCCNQLGTKANSGNVNFATLSCSPTVLGARDLTLRCNPDRPWTSFTAAEAPTEK